MAVNSRHLSAESGQAGLLVTLGTVMLFGILGLVVDVGYAYYLRQVAQAAVDSAVTAGTVMANDYGGSCNTQVLCQSATTCPANPPSPPVTDFDAACLYAKANDFSTTATRSMKISSGVGSPPGAPGVKNSTYWMNATALQTYPVGFLRVLGIQNSTVSAQATGALIGTAAGGCIYVLDPSGSAAFNLVGTSNIQSDCGVHVNSSASDAVTAKGGAVLNASVVDVVGGVNLKGGAVITPTANTGAAVVTDPLANLESPTFSGCNQINTHLTGGTNNLSPGVYCNGIQASGQAVLNFSPGVYILNGGGLKISSANVTLNGSGVFFYNTSSGYAFGPVVITGEANINLSAPTSGTYKGILLFQDRNVTSSAISAFGGGSTETLSGTVYLPTGQLDFKGGSSTESLTMALIAKNLNIAGNAYLKKDTTGDLTGIKPTFSALIQ